jgi:penicillin-binding protein 1C
MNWLHRNCTSSAPKPPPGLLAEETLGAPGRREWFIRGTENAILPGPAGPGFRILYPVSGTIFALDPDIPAEDQKLFFEAQPKDSLLQWVLDGDPIGNASSLFLWNPVRGKHALALVDASAHTVDSVTFEVRGNI